MGFPLHISYSHISLGLFIWSCSFQAHHQILRCCRREMRREWHWGDMGKSWNYSIVWPLLCFAAFWQGNKAAFEETGIVQHISPSLWNTCMMDNSTWQCFAPSATLLHCCYVLDSNIIIHFAIMLGNGGTASSLPWTETSNTGFFFFFEEQMTESIWRMSILGHAYTKQLHLFNKDESVTRCSSY